MFLLKELYLGVILLLLCLHATANDRCCLTSCVHVTSKDQCQNLVRGVTTEVGAIEVPVEGIETGNAEFQEQMEGLLGELEILTAKNGEINATIQRQQSEIELLTAKLNDLELEVYATRNATENGLRQDCEMYFRGKCFKLPPSGLTHNGTLAHPNAVELCAETGWKLANLYSEELLFEVQDYIRERIPGMKSEASLWLGMTRDQDIGVNYLSNGWTAPELMWSHNYPKPGANYTKIYLRVSLNTESIVNGMVNAKPARTLDGVLCEL